MTEIDALPKSNEMTHVTAQDQILVAHEFLKMFIGKFEEAKRGGIHDFIEIALFNMLRNAIDQIDKYLLSGHRHVNANEIMIIAVDAWQKVLDGMKRNLENLDQVNFK